ncbi:cyclin-dependent kinase-like 1 [Nasonia vitripennis]|uniref:cyclin-dependent kinase n=1 Tax=Nasonia vitripennis TaxID=7425 RepID=A0A7M7IN33_NASVI|nr:cyclin-dependent kinase-like 1 [Nasonia vitripennis]XP_016837137.1 cyclin-dependent kinase-like 1 [Nasonia vitripennis]XP_031779153.1 cyclin-dependent kinase-like 1 [Nasonia vitripennis]
MDKYENIEVVGEGSYGVVMKCRHKETGQVVAIKKFLESVDNVHVRKLAFREIRMLKRLRHENLVSLIEVFRRKKRFYLVFEYLDHTILDELEAVGGGLGLELSRRHIFQVLRGLNFCHNNHIMHRDVKPENVLVSPHGVIKLCDFGFARIVTGPNESCTDYVATRWYRAPELLVGDPRYGRAVDTWAAGCLFAELLTGEPLFPGDSDVDQLFRITRLLGGLCGRHQSLMNRSSNGRSEARALRKASIESLSYRSSSGPNNPGAGIHRGSSGGLRSLRALLPSCSSTCLDFLSQCLRMDPETRPSCANLLQHPLFMQDCFAEKFLLELRDYVAQEASENPLLQMRRDEERRLSVLSLEEPQRIYSGAARWHMKLIPSMSHEKPADHSDTPHDSLNQALRSRGTLDQENHNQQQQQQLQNNQQIQKSNQQRNQLHLTRPRELCFIGPSTVAPNATYIRRLEHKGLLPASMETNGKFTLPALRDQQLKAAGYKRTKLDLSSQIA